MSSPNNWADRTISVQTLLAMFRLLFAMLIGVALVGCGGGGADDSADDRGIAHVTVFMGDGQTTRVATELASPVVVLVTNKAGAPLAGALVTFHVTSGAGSVFAGTATSDSNGLARERWTLGSKASDSQRVEARMIGADGLPLTATFSATATAGPASRLVVTSGGGQSAAQAQPLPAPILVMAQDGYGNPVAGVSISFSANSSGGVTPGFAISDVKGEVSAIWMLGASLGTQVLTVSAPALPPVEISANATKAAPGLPTNIQRALGDAQTVVQHATLPSPLVVWVTDTLGNGVPGVQVAFSPAPGSHFASGMATTTQPLNDAGGYAAWNGYFHDAGVQVVEASTPTGAKVTFYVMVTPSTHQFDGIYGCHVSSGATGDIRLVISNGMVTGQDESDPGHMLSATTLNEGTGAFTGTYRASLDTRFQLSGAFTIDAQGQSTGSGGYTILSIGHNVGTGTWACTRQ